MSHPSSIARIRRLLHRFTAPSPHGLSVPDMKVRTVQLVRLQEANTEMEQRYMLVQDQLEEAAESPLALPPEMLDRISTLEKEMDLLEQQNARLARQMRFETNGGNQQRFTEYVDDIHAQLSIATACAHHLWTAACAHQLLAEAYQPYRNN